MFRRKPLGRAFDRFNLVEPVDDRVVDFNRVKRLSLNPLIIGEVLKAILRIKAKELARWVALRISPEPDVKAVSIKYYWPVAVHLFETVGIEFCLMPAPLGVDGGLLGFDNRKRVPVIVPQNVIRVAA